MTIPPWVAKFVGIPYKAQGRDYAGADCYAILYLAYRDVFGIEIPSYAGDYLDPLERDEVAALIRAELPRGWHLATGWSRAGDGVLMRVLGEPWHVGLLVNPETFVHVSPQVNPSSLERLDSARWNRRIVGIYRHEALA